MECSQLAMAFKDQDMKLIPLPPPGTEYERFPSPPPSDHSSQDDLDDQKQDDQGTKKKKVRFDAEAFLRIRNENVLKYFNELKKRVPPSYQEELLKLRKEWEAKLLLLKKRAARLEVLRKELDEELECSSDTDWETGVSFPRNIEKTRQYDFQAQCYQNIVDQRKQAQKNGPLINGVLFSHVNFKMIMDAKWSLIKMKRLERILEGKEVGCRVDPEWVDFEKEIQKYYGPMDTESVHFAKLVEAFQMQREEMIAKMFKEEMKMIEKMLKEKKFPSDLPQQLAALKVSRSRLEATIAAMVELHCDQNPYTNPDSMDFWVVPRPKRTIEVYDIRNKETEKFLEFNLPLDEKGVPQLKGSNNSPNQAEMGQNQLLVRKGYNAAVFDVGWHYSPMLAFWDIVRDCIQNVHSGNCSHSLNEKKWKRRLLELRGSLMKFNPFGVESSVFSRHVYDKKWWLEDTVMFFSLYEERNGADRLVDLYFPQTLLGNGRGENKVIVFDNLLEGVIATPVEMLKRVWARIKFLIEEQPNQLLPLEEFQQIYEDCFGQKFFPLQWGFKDVEDFFENILKYLPEEITGDVAIVTEDEVEMEKSDAEKRAEIDAKWAAVLKNDEDDGDDDDFDFLYDDLFAELIHEGPWVGEGEVYRVLDR